MTCGEGQPEAKVTSDKDKSYSAMLDVLTREEEAEKRRKEDLAIAEAKAKAEALGLIGLDEDSKLLVQVEPAESSEMNVQQMPLPCAENGVFSPRLAILSGNEYMD